MIRLETVHQCCQSQKKKCDGLVEFEHPQVTRVRIGFLMPVAEVERLVFDVNEFRCQSAVVSYRWW